MVPLTAGDPGLHAYLGGVSMFPVSVFFFFFSDSLVFSQILDSGLDCNNFAFSKRISESNLVFFSLF